MNPDQDKRYFKLDFRRLKGYSPDDKQYEQLWEICKAIWPEYEQPEVFERLDLRKFPRFSILHQPLASVQVELTKTVQETTSM